MGSTPCKVSVKKMGWHFDGERNVAGLGLMVPMCTNSAVSSNAVLLCSPIYLCHPFHVDSARSKGSHQSWRKHHGRFKVYITLETLTNWKGNGRRACVLGVSEENESKFWWWKNENAQRAKYCCRQTGRKLHGPNEYMGNNTEIHVPWSLTHKWAEEVKGISDKWVSR